MSTLSPELLQLLADPETHEPLALATDSELGALRSLVREGKISRRSGQPVGEFEGALLPPGRRVAYVIESGIPNLLVDERLELPEAL